jgi:hypothetical protein
MFLLAGLAGFLANSYAVPASPPDPPPGLSAIDFCKFLDANTINMCVSNLGTFAGQMGGPGLEFPKGSGKYCVYTSGLWICAKVNGEIRVALGGYTPEFRPGCIYPDGTYDPDSDPRHHVFKIAKGDTASPDYTGWPAGFGAPVDEDGKPLLVGSQTLWCVYHDANPMFHWAPEGGTAPLGIEVQQTAFASDWQVAFGKVVFVEFKMINRLANTLDSTYFGIFCDPDVGGFLDDLIGCDPALNLGFGYNATNADLVYGAQPPCIGYDIVRCPLDDSGIELGMTAFRGYANGGDPMSSSECYDCLRGLALDGSPIIDPTTGNPTTFQMSGDPVQGTGWLDSDGDDRRFIMASGPFTMEPGDTQQVAVAIVAARGWNRITAVKLMKELDRAAQAAYNAGLNGQFLPATEGSLYEADPGRRGADLPAEMNSARPNSPAGSPPVLTVGPNPARGSVAIDVRVSRPGSYALRVVDTEGRVVRTLLAGDILSAGHSLVWDGCDEGGHPAPAGIYFAHLAGNQTGSAKIVLLR